MTANPAPKGGSHAKLVAACAELIRACGLTLHDLADHMAQPTEADAAAPAPAPIETLQIPVFRTDPGPGVDIDAAHRWAAAPPAKPERKRHVPKPATGQQITIAPKKAPPVKTAPVGEVVGMGSAPRSFRPAPVDTRYSVAPGEELTGGFSAGRLGIDPTTGRPWEKRT